MPRLVPDSVLPHQELRIYDERPSQTNPMPLERQPGMPPYYAMTAPNASKANVNR